MVLRNVQVSGQCRSNSFPRRTLHCIKQFYSLVQSVVLMLWLIERELHAQIRSYIGKREGKKKCVFVLKGRPPAPRAAHASATLGCRGYICGGRVMVRDVQCCSFASVHDCVV